MARVFTDIYVKNCTDVLLKNAWRLGYSSILCEGGEFQTAGHTRLRAVKKIIVNAETSSKLKSQLRSIDHGKTFITVHPLSIDVARWSAHDTRVDSILMTPSNMRFFDKKQLSIMKYYAKPLEVHLPYLIHSDSDIRGALYRKLNLFVGGRVALLLGSAAEHWVDMYPPISIIKFLLTQYDIPEDFSRTALTDTPRQVITNKAGPP
ncbi:MAG: hypothetical protein QXW94_00670 [Desulfurococcaceae archaeon]